MEVERLWLCGLSGMFMFDKLSLEFSLKSIEIWYWLRLWWLEGVVLNVGLRLGSVKTIGFFLLEFSLVSFHAWGEFRLIVADFSIFFDSLVPFSLVLILHSLVQGNQNFPWNFSGLKDLTLVNRAILVSNNTVLFNLLLLFLEVSLVEAEWLFVGLSLGNGESLDLCSSLLVFLLHIIIEGSLG